MKQLKPNLDLDSFYPFGLIALIVVMLVSLGTVQPLLGSGHNSNPYLTGSWMLTVDAPESDPFIVPCIFSPNLTESSPEGTMLCSAIQLPTMEGRGEQAANIIGGWERISEGVFDLRAVRMVYDEKSNILSKPVALARLRYVEEEGRTILKGEGMIVVESPEGKALQTIPNIKVRAVPMKDIAEYEIP